MADGAPLLPCYNSSESLDGLGNLLPAESTTIDDTLESYVDGNCRSSQLLQAIFVSLAWAFDAQQTFISVFTDAEPAWHCTAVTCSSSSSSSSGSTPCGLPPGSWAWDSPAHTSVVSEWSLQCAGSAVVGLPASAYFAGCLIGGLLLSTLADTVLGRKTMLFLSCFTMSLSAALTAVSPNLWAYAAMRFLCGCGRATVGTTSLVLSTEMVGKRWREKVSISSFFSFTLGFLSLPAVAYLNRGASWRTLYLWTSIPCFFYSVLIYFRINESPRWLLVRGRRDEAIQALKSMAAPNDRNNAIASSFSKLIVEENTSDVDVFSAMKMLWETRWALRRLLATMIAGFGLGLLYYGLPLNVGNLGSDLYLSVTFNALAELPSSLITLFLVGRVNRRSSTVAFATASGAFSLACVAVTAGPWQMAAEVASFFSACTAFNFLLIYCIELFPTCVRNSAIAMLRQAVVLGGVLAPILVVEGRKRSFVSFGVFGVVVGSCGMFLACLPETRGRNMCDTMEEEESKLMINASSNTP
ncbi:organic cation/carnitine transporter 2-like [Curcuma longa]|uniref:organic cation/carnitine transporter 2-like n=1 Tax=Curcuma longa TaxID=136217 RepID=UPI003D9E25A1